MSLFKKKFIIFFASILLILMFFGFSSFCLAAATSQLGGLENTATGIGYEQNSAPASVQISSWIGMIVKTLIGFVGIVFMVLIFMGAFDIISAGGNDEKVKKGRDKIRDGAIGILIVFGSYLFTNVILDLAGGGDFKIFRF